MYRKAFTFVGLCILCILVSPFTGHCQETQKSITALVIGEYFDWSNRLNVLGKSVLNETNPETNLPTAWSNQGKSVKTGAFYSVFLSIDDMPLATRMFYISKGTIEEKWMPDRSTFSRRGPFGKVRIFIEGLPSPLMEIALDTDNGTLSFTLLTHAVSY